MFVAAAVLTPGDTYVCPSETITFSCVLDREQNRELKWKITFMHQSITSIERTFIASIDQPGRTRKSENNDGQSVNFTLNSASPNINSTLTATIQNSPEFRQMSVMCSNGSEAFGKPHTSTVYIITRGEFNEGV